jgi:hypothetical protein
MKKVEQNVVYFCNFKKTSHNKQSPIERKFAQSGHPDGVGPTWRQWGPATQPPRAKGGRCLRKVTRRLFACKVSSNRAREIHLPNTHSCAEMTALRLPNRSARFILAQ